MTDQEMLARFREISEASRLDYAANALDKLLIACVLSNISVGVLSQLSDNATEQVARGQIPEVIAVKMHKVLRAMMGGVAALYSFIPDSTFERFEAVTRAFGQEVGKGLVVVDTKGNTLGEVS